MLKNNEKRHKVSVTVTAHEMYHTNTNVNYPSLKINFKWDKKAEW